MGRKYERKLVSAGNKRWGNGDRLLSHVDHCNRLPVTSFGGARTYTPRGTVLSVSSGPRRLLDNRPGNLGPNQKAADILNALVDPTC
jgi:hypothetical protein